MKKLLSLLIITVVLLFGTGVKAQTKETKLEDGYGYEFEDDPLSAGGFGPNDARIRIRRGAQRATLIKPRTQFIRELIESVEQL